MKDYEKNHWKVFNALGKVVGVLFAFGGGFTAISGLVNKDGLMAVMSLVVAVLGILLLLAKPSRSGGDNSES
jgi:hypothetical protein